MAKEEKQIKEEVAEYNKKDYSDTDTIMAWMLYDELYDKLKADGYNVTKSDIWKYSKFMFDRIEELLNEGKDIRLEKLCIFEHKYRDAREGRNPSTGEKVDVPAKKVVKIRPLRRTLDATKIIDEEE